MSGTPNPYAAALALIPNLLPIGLVMGTMGWCNIPLDMATVMIASVSLGIGIDCAIHYLFRYREEIARDGDIARAIVHESVWDEFCERIVKQTQQLRLGYGFDDEVFMGPLISENGRSRFRRYGRAVTSKGNEVLLGGTSRTRMSRRGFYVTPAIYAIDWREGSSFLNEEPPGPTLLLYKVSSTDEAVALHNQAHYRLATSLFPKPDAKGLPHLVDRLRTGSLYLNRGTTHSVLPLEAVGLGRSSSGQTGGLGLLRMLTYPRAQVVATESFDEEDTLPGTNWEDENTDIPRVEVEAEMDVSAMLEPL